MGSKNRIAKEILPIMLNEREERVWVEPFVGGANMIDKVQGQRIGADINPYLIETMTTNIKDMLDLLFLMVVNGLVVGAGLIKQV